MNKFGERDRGVDTKVEVQSRFSHNSGFVAVVAGLELTRSRWYEDFNLFRKTHGIVPAIPC